MNSTTASDVDNKDSRLRRRITQVLDERRALGLDGLVGDLDFVRVHTEPDRQESAVRHFLAHTGYRLADAFETPDERTFVLTCPESADVVFQTRFEKENPFAPFNKAPKSAHLPHTRLESFVFSCSDMARYVEAQRQRDTVFMTPDPIETDTYRFIQTQPSALTGNSIGVIEWKGDRGRYQPVQARSLDVPFSKPDRPYLARIGTLDHIATRVHAESRDPAILEFMGLTNYAFDFAIHLPELNSITNVARLPGARFALVFTSGQHALKPGERLGPTEQFIENYGPRVHHLAFITDEIADTDRALREDGLGFLSELVGDPADGIQQSFSEPAPDTLLVNEYIHRYDGFDGFFTLFNVNRLTEATARQ